MFIINKFKNKIVIGSAQFGLKYGVRNKNTEISQSGVNDILRLAYNKNINEIDTAFNYGNSHKKIINFLKKEKRKKFIITTKINIKELKLLSKVDLKKKILNFKSNFSGKCEVNLLCHNQEILHDKNKKILIKFFDFKKKKLVKKIGVSVYDSKYILKGLNCNYIDIVEAPGNILDQRLISSKFLKRKKNIEKKIYLRSIFLQGILLTNPKTIKNIKLKSKINVLNQLSKKLKMKKTNLCVNFALQIIKPKKIIFGIDNLKQLNKFIKIKYKKLNNSNDFKKLLIRDKKIIDPRKW